MGRPGGVPGGPYLSADEEFPPPDFATDVAPFRLRAGRFIEYPAYGDPGNRSVNALYCALLHAAGKPRDHFNLQGATKEVDKPGPLSELLT